MLCVTSWSLLNITRHLSRFRLRPGALIDPFMIFSTSDWDQLADIRQNGQKERFKIGKDVKFERDSLKTNSFNSYNSFTKSPNFTDFFCKRL